MTDPYAPNPLTALLDPRLVAQWLDEVERHRRLRAGGSRLPVGDTTLPPLPAPESQPLMTVAQVSERMQVSRNAIYELAHRSDFPSIRVGRSIRFKWSRVEQWLEENQGE